MDRSFLRWIQCFLTRQKSTALNSGRYLQTIPQADWPIWCTKPGKFGVSSGQAVDRRCGVDDGDLKDRLSEDAELRSPRDWCLGWKKHIPKKVITGWSKHTALHRNHMKSWNRCFRKFHRFLCAVHILLIDQWDPLRFANEKSCMSKLGSDLQLPRQHCMGLRYPVHSGFAFVGRDCQGGHPAHHAFQRAGHGQYSLGLGKGTVHWYCTVG